MDEQTVTDSPEQRLASFFNPQAGKPEPEEEEQTETTEASTEEEQAQEDPDASDEVGEPFEDDGEVYQLPPKLASKVKEWKEGALRREDYTRKTQEVSAILRQVSAVAETAQMNEELEREIAPDREELTRIKHTLNEFKKIDWTNLDITQHLTLSRQMEQLKERQTEIQGEIGAKTDSVKQKREANKRHVIAEGQKYLSQTIKGWGEGSIKEVVSAAKDTGFSDEEIAGMLDARVVRALWEASQYRKLQSGKTQALATAQKAPPVVKPGAVTTNQESQKLKAQRVQLKKTGRVQDAYALLKNYL